MKTISCFAICVLAAICATGQQRAPTTNASPAIASTPGPRIQFKKLIHDFGKVTGGDVVKATFVFTNIGDKLLEITGVHPSCGCTTTGEWTHQVEPGKTGAIPLQFNSANFSGVVIKTATVTCNDPAMPLVTLQLKANVWRPIDITPQLAILQLTTEAPSNAVTVKILNNIETPLTLSDLESKTPAFAADLRTINEGKEYELIVRTVAPFPSNNVQGQITMKSSSTNLPVVSVTAYANVQHTVVAMPNQITLPPAPLTNTNTQTVWIRINSTNAVTVSDPVINVKGAEVKLSAFQQNKYYSLAVTFPAGLTIDPAEHAELTVKTSHAAYPVLKVPVVQPQPAPLLPKGASASPVPGAGQANTAGHRSAAVPAASSGVPAH